MVCAKMRMTDLVEETVKLMVAVPEPEKCNSNGIAKVLVIAERDFTPLDALIVRGDLVKMHMIDANFVHPAARIGLIRLQNSCTGCIVDGVGKMRRSGSVYDDVCQNEIFPI